VPEAQTKYGIWLMIALAVAGIILLALLARLPI
jgi:hypothetical protein